jgi:hypothetical protein
MQTPRTSLDLRGRRADHITELVDNAGEASAERRWRHLREMDGNLGEARHVSTTTKARVA